MGLKRRAAAACLIAALSSLLSTSPATDWSNGPNGPNGFGTHDWILDRAWRNAGTPNWIDIEVALKATDDPDTKDGIDHASGTWWHVYDRWGDDYGDAHEAAEVWFERIQTRLRNGNERGASKALGYLAHIVGDVAQPMHTDQRTREDRIHSSYEQAVDRRIHDFGSGYDGVHRADPRARTVQLARVAHRSYLKLIRTYDRDGFTGEVKRLTGRQLRRAVEALSDLIASL